MEESLEFHTFFIRDKLQFAGIWRAAVVVRRHHSQEIDTPLVLEVHLG